jgi:nicotinamidase-related amidase
MQPEFSASNNANVLKNNQKQIRLAKRRNDPIIFVEYTLCGHTHKVLMDLVQNYKSYKVIRKPRDDGSEEVLRCCNKYHFPTGHFKITGVNIDACVRDTVHGLLDKYPYSKIEVIKEACNGFGSSSWKNYRKARNLKFKEILHA